MEMVKLSPTRRNSNFCITFLESRMWLNSLVDAISIVIVRLCKGNRTREETKMVRPPRGEKGGAKKGVWTREEDVILISYIKEHCPGNWYTIPPATGLLRCGKSCKLRWTNHLKPGIKRGNFTPNEEEMIIHLQASLGNKWTTIATYLPHRTENDIKNFWNSHLKKKIEKLQTAAMAPQNATVHESKSPNMAGDSSAYVSSVENISKLLQTWNSSSSLSLKGNATTTNFDYNINFDDFCRDFGEFPTSFFDELQRCKLQENGISCDDHEPEKTPSLDRGLMDGCGTFDQEIQFFQW